MTRSGKQLTICCSTQLKLRRKVGGSQLAESGPLGLHTADPLDSECADGPEGVLAAERLGLSGVGWHSFRHRYRAWLDATGAPIGLQQELMRHGHPATTGIFGGALLMSSKRDANSKVVRMALAPAVRQENVA